MEPTEKRLENLIDDFLKGNINCESFEEQFSMVYDFEELDCGEQTVSYFTAIRELLEKYTFSENDLEKYPDYYIDCSQLVNLISQVNADYKS
jgi:hypothetical protein